MQLNEAEGQVAAITNNLDGLQGEIAELEAQVCILLLVTTNCLWDYRTVITICGCRHCTSSAGMCDAGPCNLHLAAVLLHLADSFTVWKCANGKNLALYSILIVAIQS